MSDFLVLKGISKRFGRTVALDGLSLQIPELAIAALVGANGAGKTTAFALVGGFLFPDKGLIEVAGMPLTKYRQSGGTIGILPQDMQYFENRSIWRQLYLFARLSGLSTREARNEVSRVLELLNLQDKAKSLAGDLSHGMRVRLGVAQALIAYPPLILLDEPTAGLDPRRVVEFRETVETLRGRSTVVISSHDLSELETLCDYVCIIEHGKLVRQGPMKQLLSRISKVIYKISPLKGGLTELMAKLPGVELTLEGEDMLIAKFDASLWKVEDLNRVVLGWLLEHNVTILELRQQASLEEAYLEVTGSL